MRPGLAVWPRMSVCAEWNSREGACRHSIVTSASGPLRRRRDPHMTTGDLLIHTIAAGKGATYALSGMPDAAEVLFPSMGAASRYARALAKPTGVDVWAEQGSGYLLLIGRFRPPRDRTRNQNVRPSGR